MSAVQGSFTRITIYVSLLGEGTPVYRPTEAVRLANGLYQLLPTGDYDPEDEKWEFPPGSVVRAEKREGRDGECLIAVRSNAD